MTTDKIIKALLGAKFPGIDLDALTEIIMHTPNPDISTEVLCGLYEEPEVSPLISLSYIKDHESRTNYIFISYDKYTNEVKYSYQERIQRSYWCKNDEETPEYEAATDKQLLDVYSERAAQSLGLSKEEFTKLYTSRTIYGPIGDRVYESTMRLNYWNGTR